MKKKITLLVLIALMLISSAVCAQGPNGRQGGGPGGQGGNRGGGTTDKSSDTQLQEMIARGFSAAVYTQTTDVEIEVNGLMTYDRRFDKVDIPRIHEINQQVINTLR